MWCFTKQNLTKLLITSCFYFLLTPVSSAAKINDFSANYDLYHNELFVGQSQRVLQTTNTLSTLTSVSKTAGIAAWFFDIDITEISQLQLKNDQLRFLSYRYDEKDKDKHKTYELKLNNAQQFYNSHTKKHYPVTSNLHDTLGFSVAIMQDLKAGKRELIYQIAEKDHLKPYILKYIKTENLPSAEGEIKTLKMEHFDPQSRHRFTFWCAEEMNFLPVRIRNIKQNGDEILLNLTHFNQKPVNIPLPITNTD